MKTTIRGVPVEGTPTEIAELIREMGEEIGERLRRVLSPEPEPEPIDNIDEGHAIRVADPRFETHGFTAADVRAYCRRNDLEVGERGLVSQRLYDALRDSEAEGCESVEDVRARLMAGTAAHEAVVARRKVERRTRGPQPAGVTRERKVSAEENEAADQFALRAINSLPSSGDFKLVAERQPNDRMVACINNGTGRFSSLRAGAFEACGRQSQPREIGPYGKPLVDIYARRVTAANQEA